VEVGSAPGEPAQDRSLEAPDVLPLAGEERASRIGDDRDLAGGLVAERVDGHVADGKPELIVHAVAPHLDGDGRLGDADVQRRRNRVVAGVRRVVARRARTDDRDVEVSRAAEVAHDSD
jgi:hypothetical protein